MSPLQGIAKVITYVLQELAQGILGFDNNKIASTDRHPSQSTSPKAPLPKPSD